MQELTHCIEVQLIFTKAVLAEISCELVLATRDNPSEDDVGMDVQHPCGALRAKCPDWVWTSSILSF